MKFNVGDHIRLDFITENPLIWEITGRSTSRSQYKLALPEALELGHVIDDEWMDAHAVETMYVLIGDKNG